jgi:hypothetical protein
MIDSAEHGDKRAHGSGYCQLFYTMGTTGVNSPFFSKNSTPAMKKDARFLLYFPQACVIIFVYVYKLTRFFS